MEFQELIRVRESCRSFTEEPVTREQIETILEAARLSPSACNSQPWSFVAVCSPEAVKTCAACIQASGANAFTSQAAAFIILTEEHAQLSPRIADTMDSQHFAQLDLGLVTAHLCLAASDLGLSTCILGLFDEDKTKEAFQIPTEKRVRLIIALGHGKADAPRPKQRRPLSETARFV